MRRGQGVAARRVLAALSAAVLAVSCGASEGADAADDRGAAPARGDATPTPRGQDTSLDGETVGDSAAAPDAAVPGTVRIRVAGRTVTVEVADDDEERQRGLMFRESLPEDHGMLFVYDSERRLSFWMRNTPIPLDVAFIDRSGRIVDIQQMEPMTDDTHTSRAPAMYALEMRLGWFDEHGVEVGDAVEF